MKKIFYIVILCIVIIFFFLPDYRATRTEEAVNVQAFNIIREVVKDEQTIKDEDRIQIVNDLPDEEDEEDD